MDSAIAELDADDLAYLSEWLPADALAQASAALVARERDWIADTRAAKDDSVGRLMTRDVVDVRDDQSVADAIAALRTRTELPDQTDRLFVVDARHVLRGSVPLQTLVRAEPDTTIAAVMLTNVAAFTPDQPATDAAQAFERYDLVSAPVVDDLGKLIGRLRIDAVLDFVRVAADQDALARAGLRGAEDLFATVRQSFRNRWPWLCLNLGHGVRGVAGHRLVRGRDRPHRGTGRVDADRRQPRRQYRESDRGPGDTGPGSRPVARQSAAPGPQGTGGRRRQRPALGRTCWASSRSRSITARRSERS